MENKCIQTISEKIEKEESIKSEHTRSHRVAICQHQALSNGCAPTTEKISCSNEFPIQSGNANNITCISSTIMTNIFSINTDATNSPSYIRSTEGSTGPHAHSTTTSNTNHNHLQTTVVDSSFLQKTCDVLAIAQKANSSQDYVTNFDSKPPSSVDSKSTTNRATCTDSTSTQPTCSPESSPDDDEEDLSCGYGSCKPSCIQVFNTPTAILVFLCLANFFKGFIMNGVINVNMSTIEKRFGLTSSQAGLIASIHDITAAPVALVVSFIGSVGYKMRWLGFSLFSLSVGSFIMTIPHFAAGTYNSRSNVTDLCSYINDTSSHDSDDNSSQFLYVFLVGQLFHGIGGAILHTLGISCIDDCVKPKNAPMCMGLMLCFGTLGPAFGFFVGGQFLNIYVDINTTDQMPDITDPQWVGAWWISFLISGTITLLIAPIMFTYARELPVTKKIRSLRTSEVHENASQQKLAQTGFGTTLKDLPMTMYLLLWNPSFLFVTFTFTAEAALLDGVTTFLPKFLESQYGQSPSKASLITGCIAVPGATTGQFIGGYVCKKFNLKITEMTKVALAGFIVSLLTWGVVWLGCEKQAIVGVTHTYQDSSLSLYPSSPNLDASCNKNCSCNTEYYQPVCGANGKTYFSPCHAGCLMSNPETRVYSNCSCIGNADNGTAHNGACNDDIYCYQMFIFIPFLLITLFATFLARTPLLAVVLRCIPENQRTFGLGMNHFIRRLLGSLPGPLLFGTALDNACNIWKEYDSQETSCWIYDSFKLSINFFLLFIALRIVSILCLVIANCLYKPPSKRTTVEHVYDNRSISLVDESTNL